MNHRLLVPVLLCLCLLVVVPVSATVLQVWPTQDNSLVQTSTCSTYADLRAGAGTGFSNASDYNYGPHIKSHISSTGNYTELGRTVWLFNNLNASGLPTDAVISNVTFMLGYCGGDDELLGAPSFGLTGGTLASNTTIAVSDFNKFDANEYITRFNYTAIASLDSKMVILNEAGRNYVKANQLGAVVFYGRDSWDIDNSFTGTWASNTRTRLIFRSVTGETVAQRPYMNITYTLPIVPSQPRVYPITLNDSRIMPFNITQYDEWGTAIVYNDSMLGAEGLNISVNGTPDEFVTSSFVVKPHDDITDITVEFTELTSGVNTIPLSATEIKTVKVEYQSAYKDIGYHNISYILTPEKLFNNDSVVSVNTATQKNSVWIENATYSGYFEVGNATIGVFPAGAKIYDNKTAGGFPQPFALSADNNKQLVVITHVPSGQAEGNYTGFINITSSDTLPISLNHTVRVFNFTLPNSSLDYGIYHGSILSTTDSGIWQTEYRQTEQYTAELQDLKDHGIEYPTLYQKNDSSMDNALLLRNQSGMPQDKIFMSLQYWTNPYAYFVTNTSDANIQNIGDITRHMQGRTTAYGFGNNYIYSKDEPTVAQQLFEIPMLDAIRNNGSYTYMATSPVMNMYGNLGDKMDVPIMSTTVLGGGYNDTERVRWQALGKKIYSYNYPQLVSEQFELYRKHYGLELWVSGYDGTMPFGYQWAYPDDAQPNAWNDFDSGNNDKNRDHMATYPKTGGVVGTLQWEGFRQGVDDTRYADYLTSITGNRTEATTIINAGIAAGSDMSVIRGNLIDAILYYEGAVIPTASFTKDRPLVVIPQSMHINDTSTNTPTVWNISWGDGGWSNSTENGNQSHIYRRPGTFTIGLTVSNAAGTNTTTNNVRVTSRRLTINPYHIDMYSCKDFTYSVSRELSESERVELEQKIMNLCYNIGG
jgi:PKD repeat protein